MQCIAKMSKITLFRALENGVSCEIRALRSQTRVPALAATCSRRFNGSRAASSLHAVMEGVDAEEKATLSRIESIVGPLSSAPMVRQPRTAFEPTASWERAVDTEAWSCSSM
jgi:hypothetical protein